MHPADIHNQVEKILQSRTFAGKGQLRKLLEILRKNMESQADLKTSGVIQELWPSEVRTKRPADLATEMNRLRHALEDYYENEGGSDPVLISLPNRATGFRDGTPAKQWIVARPRNRGTEEEPSPLPRASVRRIFAWIAVVVIAAAGYAGYARLEPGGEPASARVEGSSLVIVNAEGKELWRKSFPGGFGPRPYYEDGVASRMWFADLEGKGHVSIIFSYLPAPGAHPHSSTLICYSDRGKEKWRWTPGRNLPETAGDPRMYKTYSFGVLKATRERPTRIVVASDLDPWWAGPSQVAVLDAGGKLVSEYWHSGGLNGLVVGNLDGDGKEEIIATGVARGYDLRATLVVLDPDHMQGASEEVVPGLQIHGMGSARERMRLVFPRSDLNRAAFQFNQATEPNTDNGNLRVTVEECEAPVSCPIAYEFDRNLQLIAAHPANEEFQKAHDRYFQNRVDAHPLGMEERSAFLRVRCLAGCKTDSVPVAQTYEAAASFERSWSNHRNPDGVWSYGYSEGFTNPITYYDKTAQNGINGVNAQYWLSSKVNAGTSPAAQFNHGPAFNDGNVDLLKDEFLLVAGLHGEYSDLIFVAPDSGDYSVAGAFRGAQYTVGTVVGVVVNGMPIFRSRVVAAGQVIPFSMTAKLQAREKVVFSVGPGGGLQNTGLAVTVTRPCGPNDKPMFTSEWVIRCSSERVAAGETAWVSPQN